MNKENIFTTYSLLCETPTEDDKIYYWENMIKLVPIISNLFENFSTSKILSWQHFEKLKWIKSENSHRIISSFAPTGGCINWSFENIKKICTTYLIDRTNHYRIWDIYKGLPQKQMTILPLNPRGYIFHYSTTIFGDRLKLKQDKASSWYNKLSDFRLQIQYNFNQFSDLGVNQIVDITFRENFLTEPERDKIITDIFSLIHGKFLLKRTSIKNCGFTQTFEQAYFINKELISEWKQIYGATIKLD